LQFQENLISHYNAMPVRAGGHFFGFHGGFRHPETQPQAAKRTIFKIHDLVGSGAVTSSITLLQIEGGRDYGK
jgi:hypothetical protein